MGKVLDHWIHYTFESCRRDTINYIRYSLVVFFFSFIFLKAWLIWGSGGALKNPDQHAFHHCHLISHSDDAVNQSFSLQQHCDRTKTLMENHSCCCGAAFTAWVMLLNLLCSVQGLGWKKIIYAKITRTLLCSVYQSDLLPKDKTFCQKARTSAKIKSQKFPGWGQEG